MRWVKPCGECGDGAAEYEILFEESGAIRLLCWECMYASTRHSETTFYASEIVYAGHHELLTRT